MLVLDFPRGDRCSDADWWPTVNAFEAALKSNSARGAIVASMTENLPEDHAAELLRRGIVPIHGIAEAIDAAEAAAFIGEAWRVEVAEPVAGRPPLRLTSFGTSPPVDGGEERRQVDASVPSISSAGGSKGCHGDDGFSSPPSNGGEVSRAKPETEWGSTSPDEAEAKALLVKASLPVPPGRRAANADEAVAAATALGFPVALKALGIAHKSEHGAVRLNLRDEASVRAAAEALSALGSGLYIERMVSGGIAELIVGITRDPIFGPVMTIGSGGVLVELLKDSATLLLPSTRSDIEAALRGLKMFPLLDGYRGRPKADLGAAIDAISGIAEFAVANADAIEELDINPLIVCAEGQGAWIADALLVQNRTR